MITLQYKEYICCARRDINYIRVEQLIFIGSNISRVIISSRQNCESSNIKNVLTDYNEIFCKKTSQSLLKVTNFFYLRALMSSL